MTTYDSRDARSDLVERRAAFQADEREGARALIREIEESDARFEAGLAPTTSEILSAELATARTKAERREAVIRFESRQERRADPAAQYRDAFRAYLRTGQGAEELRAMGETTNGGGDNGLAVPISFRDELATQLAQYGTLYRDFTPVNTSDGRPTEVPTRMLASMFGSGPQGQNTQVPDGDDVVYGQLSLAAFTYPTGVYRTSIQIEQDSDVVTVESAIQGYASEVIGRTLSPLSVSGSGVGEPMGLMTIIEATGAWSAGKSGGYLGLDAAKAVTVDGEATTELAAGIPAPATLRAMIAAVDPAYHAGAKFYVNVSQFEALTGITDDNGNPLILPNGPLVLWDFPIVIASEVPGMAASTIGGPILGNLQAGMYMRNAGYQLLRLRERYADSLQVGYLGWGRYDFRPRDIRAMVSVKPAGT